MNEKSQDSNLSLSKEGMQDKNFKNNYQNKPNNYNNQYKSNNNNQNNYNRFNNNFNKRKFYNNGYNNQHQQGNFYHKNKKPQISDTFNAKDYYDKTMIEDPWAKCN
jgi:hypothetical protein